MTKAKKDAAPKKEDNSLLVGLTVTSICAAAVIGYVAGQVKMAESVYKQLQMMVYSAEAVQEAETDDGTVTISGKTYKNLNEACEGLMSDKDMSEDDTEAQDETDTEAETETAE